LSGKIEGVNASGGSGSPFRRAQLRPVANHAEYVTPTAAGAVDPNGDSRQAFAQRLPSGFRIAKPKPGSRRLSASRVYWLFCYPLFCYSGNRQARTLETVRGSLFII
jgi:hypothetical protein